MDKCEVEAYVRCNGGGNRPARTEHNLRVDLLNVYLVDGLQVLLNLALVHPGEASKAGGRAGVGAHAARG